MKLYLLLFCISCLLIFRACADETTGPSDPLPETSQPLDESTESTHSSDETTGSLAETSHSADVSTELSDSSSEPTDHPIDTNEASNGDNDSVTSDDNTENSTESGEKSDKSTDSSFFNPLAKLSAEEVGKLVNDMSTGDQQTIEEQRKTDSFYDTYKNTKGKACYKYVGCFTSAQFSDQYSRAFYTMPLPPDVIKPVFNIYTPEARTIPRNYSYNATASELSRSGFNPRLKTVFIVHGFQGGLSLWMENLKDFIQMQTEDGFNSVLVDWSKGAKTQYSIAAANTRVLGACIAIFIGTLHKTFKTNNQMVYLIGHNLGAHAVSYASKRMSPKVKRITALDPAGIGFHQNIAALRLHPSDADIVDVIHTDGTFFGSHGIGTKTNNTFGHFDFYPNGGAWQPGCPESQIPGANALNGAQRPEGISCSDYRATYLPINLNKPLDDCHAMAYQCPTYEMFLEGRCADCTRRKCQLMGINPSYWLTLTMDKSTINQKYFLNTNSKDEFCLHHYQFALHITPDSDSCTGVMNFHLNYTVPDNSTHKNLTISRHLTKTVLPNNTIHTLLVTFDFKIDKILGLDLMWRRYNATEVGVRHNRGYKLKIPYIEINYMSSFDERERRKHSAILCSKGNTIVNKFLKRFKHCEPELKERANKMDPKLLRPLEWLKDMYSVDYSNKLRVFHKIKGTRIKEKIKKGSPVE